MLTVVVAVGFTVTSWIWALMASAPSGLPALFDGEPDQVLVVALPLALAAVGRLAAGVGPIATAPR